MRITVRNVALGIAILAILIAIALFIAWIKLSLDLPTSAPDASIAASSTPPVVPLVLTPTANSFFTADFEGGNSQSGIGIYSGSWQIIDDGTGNHVFQIDDSSPGQWPGFDIGSSISDGIIEYRVKYLDLDFSQALGQGLVNLYFRSQGTGGGYIFAIEPDVNRTALVWVDSNGGWSTPLDGGISTLFVQKGVWYTFRVDIKSTSFSIYLDGTLLTTVNDDRFHTGGILLSVGPKTKVQVDDISIAYYEP